MNSKDNGSNCDWYPETLMVGPHGSPKTYEFVKSAFAEKQYIHYAEFGIYQGGTAENICRLFPNATVHLFDYKTNIEEVNKKFAVYGSRVYSYGNTQKYCDSYNWSLIKLIQEQNGVPLFDYCFLDGAHTVAIDALTFFLCDRLLKVGGYMDFDDYGWRLRGSSLDPTKIPEIGNQYTDEQIDTYQVKLIVDELVKRDSRYKEIATNKIFQKV